MFSELLQSAARKRFGKTFRKTLGVYNYKIGHQQYHTLPGVIPLHTKEMLKKKESVQATLKIKQLEQNGKLLGEFRGRKFFLNQQKIPFFDVPELTDFKLKPYVSYHTPQVDVETRQRIKGLNDFTKQQNMIPRSNTLLTITDVSLAQAKHK